MHIKKNKHKYKISGRILMIPVNEIRPNPEQQRRVYSYERLMELAQSIGEVGLLNPVTITLDDGKPVLVAGERRLRAARIAGMSEIPCIAVEADRPQAALLTLIENLQREDINCFEEAEGIRRLIEVYGMTQEEASHQLGCAQSTVANRLRLLRMTQEERHIIIEEGLTERHARALLRLEGGNRMMALQRIVMCKLNVAQSEKLVDEYLNNQKPDQTRKTTIPIVRDVRLFFNTVNHAVDTMRRSGIDASAEKTETEEYIEYHVRIPKENMKRQATSTQINEFTA